LKRLLLLPLVVVVASCASSSAPQKVSLPGHGAISIRIVPNPIVAAHISGDRYRFPFDVVVHETGGRAVSITRIRADVRALGGIRVASESYDAAKIRSLGYSTTVPANGELRYHFEPEKSVPDERLFGGVTADLTVDAVDDTVTAASAGTSVTVTR